MNEPNTSRQPFQTALNPNAWVVVIQDQEGVEAPGVRTVRDYYHHLHVELMADSANTAVTEFQVQDSPDGVTWTQRYKHPATLVPGGRLSIDTHHVQARFRLLAFSHGRGSIRTILLAPESQANPDYQWPPLHCATWCEMDCETGSETQG
jgi:hypothetical protein